MLALLANISELIPNLLGHPVEGQKFFLNEKCFCLGVHLHMTDAIGDFVGNTHISEAFDTFVS